MEKELIETLHNCQNKLLDIKHILEDMGIWEQVEQKLEELE